MVCTACEIWRPQRALHSTSTPANVPCCVCYRRHVTIQATRDRKWTPQSISIRLSRKTLATVIKDIFHRLLTSKLKSMWNSQHSNAEPVCFQIHTWGVGVPVTWTHSQLQQGKGYMNKIISLIFQSHAIQHIQHIQITESPPPPEKKVKQTTQEPNESWDVAVIRTTPLTCCNQATHHTAIEKWDCRCAESRRWERRSSSAPGEKIRVTSNHRWSLEYNLHEFLEIYEYKIYIITWLNRYKWIYHVSICRYVKTYAYKTTCRQKEEIFMQERKPWPSLTENIYNLWECETQWIHSCTTKAKSWKGLNHLKAMKQLVQEQSSWILDVAHLLPCELSTIPKGNGM